MIGCYSANGAPCLELESLKILYHVSFSQCLASKDLHACFDDRVHPDMHLGSWVESRYPLLACVQTCAT
jgi:hypothetical protein